MLQNKIQIILNTYPAILILDDSFYKDYFNMYTRHSLQLNTHELLPYHFKQ